MKRAAEWGYSPAQMPNFFSAFQSEVFRPLVSLLIPGAIATSPWYVFFLLRFPTFRKIVSDNHAESAFVVLLAVLFAGLVIEAQGSRIETIFDKLADKQTGGEHIRNWYEYLRTAFVADPIGRRYIRSVVLRLKFELGVAIAMFPAVVGVLVLRHAGTSWRLLWPTTVFGVLVGVLELREAHSTHALLAHTRAEMMKPIRIIGGHH